MKMLLYVCVVVLTSCLRGLSAETIEYLTPPLIEESTIDERVSCTRPMRNGKFNISTEEKDGKLLVHCYGHGGAGCTTLFGSVNKALELFEKCVDGVPKAPVRVVGCGIIGMTAAIELILRGYEVSAITAKEFYDIPSWKNAGYFAMVSIKTDPEEQLNLERIGLSSFKEFKKIYEDKHAYITSDCIRLLPVYCSADTDAGVEDLERQGLIPPREYVTLDFGNGVTHPNFVKFYTYFMDTTRMMQQLRRTVARLGIPIEKAELKSFDEISEGVVFNCSGLGAKALNGDENMIAVRGHLFNLNHNAGEGHMDYMIYTKVEGEAGNDAYVYMFPKNMQVTEEYPKGHDVNGTLGGSFIPNTDQLSESELAELDAQEFEKLYQRNLKFFWGKKTLN